MRGVYSAGIRSGVLRFSSESPRARDIADALAEADGPDDMCLVVGGDGAMLRAIQRYGNEPAYLGVNGGHLGFLMNDFYGTTEEIAAEVRALLASQHWSIQAFPRLRMRAVGAHGEHEAFAVNDVYVERQAQTCHLSVEVDGVEVVRQMVADGIVTATPLGSTAYSFSAGGTAAHPLVKAIHLTAICPHTPRLQPILLPPTSKIHIEVLDPAQRPARAVADGVAYEDVYAVEIESSGDFVRLVYREGHDFTATMIRKILRP
jgi:NAD+ kinase